MGSRSGSVVRNNAGSGSGSSLDQCGSTTLERRLLRTYVTAGFDFIITLARRRNAVSMQQVELHRRGAVMFLSALICALVAKNFNFALQFLNTVITITCHGFKVIVHKAPLSHFPSFFHRRCLHCPDSVCSVPLCASWPTVLRCYSLTQTHCLKEWLNCCQVPSRLVGQSSQKN